MAQIVLERRSSLVFLVAEVAPGLVHEPPRARSAQQPLQGSDSEGERRRQQVVDVRRDVGGKSLVFALRRSDMRPNSNGFGYGGDFCRTDNCFVHGLRHGGGGLALHPSMTKVVAMVVAAGPWLWRRRRPTPGL
jgi:hypothetical protein